MDLMCSLLLWPAILPCLGRFHLKFWYSAIRSSLFFLQDMLGWTLYSNRPSVGHLDTSNFLYFSRYNFSNIFLLHFFKYIFFTFFQMYFCYIFSTHRVPIKRPWSRVLHCSFSLSQIISIDNFIKSHIHSF